MPKSQQPLFEILNQAGQNGIDTVGCTNKNLVYKTATGDISSAPNVENFGQSSCQISPVQVSQSSLSSATHVIETFSPISDQEHELVAVTLRREKFSTTGRCERLNPDNIPENPVSKLGVTPPATNHNHSSGSCGSGSECNGMSLNIQPNTFCGSSGRNTSCDSSTGPNTSCGLSSGPNTSEVSSSGPDTSEGSSSGLNTSEGLSSGPNTSEGLSSGPNALQGSSSCQVVTNGSGGLAKDHKSDSADSAFETEEPLSPNFDFLANKGEWDLRRSQLHHPFRQALSEVLMPSSVQRRMSLVTVKERGYARLEMELSRAQKALERKDEEVDELRGIRERLMKEVSDFTAALFEEVNSQLNEAALSEQQARRQLKEAESKIEVLTAEVAALKDLVLTSTPSSPNKHLNPQIDPMAKKDKLGLGKPFWKTHRRSTSHHQFTKDSREMKEATEQHSLLKELDTVVYDEFIRWRLQPTVEFNGQFFTRVQREDIQPCLSFKNTQLADRLLESVRTNTLSIEPIPGDQSFPRKCCLSESHKLCNYKIKFEGDDEWYYISQMSRNRITTVCDFYAYLRYIVQGLVKCSDKDIFAELVRLRNQMTQARLGLI